MDVIRIALAEDIPNLARAMKDKLALNEKFKLKHHALNGKALIEYLEQDHNIDVILMDIKMPEMNGVAATEIISKRWPHVKIVMCTIFDDDEHIFNAILAGAAGYLLKDESPQNLFRAIEECLEGGAPMSPFIAKRSLELLRKGGPANNAEVPSEDYNLTKREIEILEQLCKGLTYTAIADNLFVSPGTVRKHIENIYRKLHVNNKVEAIQLAERHRLIS